MDGIRWNRWELKCHSAVSSWKNPIIQVGKKWVAFSWKITPLYIHLRESIVKNRFTMERWPLDDPSAWGQSTSHSPIPPLLRSRGSTPLICILCTPCGDAFKDSFLETLLAIWDRSMSLTFIWDSWKWVKLCVVSCSNLHIVPHLLTPFLSSARQCAFMACK